MLTFKYKTSPQMQPHIEKVLNGEYAITYLAAQLSKIITSVVDLGANIGSYAFWASQAFPLAHIYAYEPDPENFEQFKTNLKASGIPEWRYTIRQAAVLSHPDPHVTFHKSAINCGMHSVIKTMTGKSTVDFEVPVIAPKDLPNADILKADTEGCEVDIISTYLKTYAPLLISYEFHSYGDRVKLYDLLNTDYILCTGSIMHHDLGTLNWLRKDTFKIQ